MKILIDIGHPAHVHYFRNFIEIMESGGHKFFVVSKKRGSAPALLNHFGIKHVLRSDYPKSIFGKLIKIPFTDLLILKYALNFKPDLLLGFSGTHISHVGYILKKTSIVFDDTENASFAHASYRPFASVILTPDCFEKNLGPKQLKFKSYMELAYLHPKRFRSDPKIYKLLKIGPKDKYVVLRFVSWRANHDVGHKGITDQNKIKAVTEFSKYARVFISSEVALPNEIQGYKINIPFHKMHDVLAGAYLLFGESATMASECAALGTPAIYIDNDGRGYTNEEEQRYGLVYNYSESNNDQELAIKKGVEILKEPDIKTLYDSKRERLVSDKIDLTAFMVWFVGAYPESAGVLKSNPDYQNNFM